MEVEAGEGGGERKAKAQAMTKEKMEAEIERAMRARVADFKNQADSLTLEGVRRALEKDLGLKTFSLDAHKKFIKQCLEEVFYGADDENTTDISEKNEVQANKSVKEESEDAQASPLKNDASSMDDQGEKSHAFDENKPADHEREKGQAPGGDLSEDVIKEAIKRRASYFRNNLETFTLQEVRRTLEEDLKLEKKTLDAYKSFITKELEEVLEAPEDVKPANGIKKNRKEGSHKVDEPKTSKGSKRARLSDLSDANDSYGEDRENDEDVRPKKRVAERGKPSTKRQKKVTEEKKPSGSKGKKPAQLDLDRTSEEVGENSSEDDRSHSSAEEDSKKKQKPAQVYGKQVEHLKSIIKSCGMGVPPSVYRRVKQAPESKRESYLIKELKEILEKEGLSTNPSEKEIKAVKKRKERAKELEGIDMSNIISSSRRRTTSSYIPPQKPKIEVESESDDEEDEEEDDEDEDDAENGEDGDEGDNDGGDASEGSGEDAEDESD